MSDIDTAAHSEIARPFVRHSPRLRPGLFLTLTAGLVACAVVRSPVATRLDDFDQDSPWHITAGVSYVRLHDFRLNPEHPPLVKLWVGEAFARSKFHLASLR